MSWLSDAWHGVESAVSDVGSWAASNASWLVPVGIGAGALLTGGLALGALGGAGLFGAEAAGEAGALGAGEALGGAGAEAFGAGSAGIEAGIGGTAADVAAAEAIPGAVDISVTPWTGAALDLGGLGGAAAGEGAALSGEALGTEAAVGAGELGGVGSDVLAGGSLDTLLTGGTTGVEGGVGGLGTDVAALQAADEGGLSGVGGGDLTGVTAGGGTSDVPLAGELPAEAPSETVAGRFPMPDSGEAMPTGGTFSQAATAAEQAPLSYAGTPASAAPQTTAFTGIEPSATVGPTTGDVAGSAVSGDNALVAGGRSLDTTLGGFGKGIEGALGSPWVKYGVPLAAIGGIALRGPGKLPPQTQANQGIANTLASTGATQINLANAGQILPAQQAQLDINAQNEKNKLYQLYASRGIDPNSSTDYTQGVQQIDQATLAARSAIIQQMISNGLSFETAASNILTQAANEQVSLDNNFRSSLTSAIGSFGFMAALGSRGGGGGGVGASSVSTGG